MLKLQNDTTRSKQQRQQEPLSQNDNQQLMITSIQQYINQLKDMYKNQNNRLQELQQKQKETLSAQEQEINDIEQKHNDRINNLKQQFQEQLSQYAKQYGKQLDQMKTQLAKKVMPVPVVQVTKEKPMPNSNYDQIIQTELTESDIAHLDKTIQDLKQIIEELNIKQQDLIKQNNDLTDKIKQLEDQITNVQQISEQHRLKTKIIRMEYVHNLKFSVPVQNDSSQQSQQTKQDPPQTYEQQIQCGESWLQSENKDNSSQETDNYRTAQMEMKIEDLRSKILWYQSQIKQNWDDLYKQKEIIGTISTKTKIQRLPIELEKKFQAPYQIQTKYQLQTLQQQPIQDSVDKIPDLEGYIEILNQQLNQQQINYLQKIQKLEYAKDDLTQKLVQLQHDYKILEQADSENQMKLKQYAQNYEQIKDLTQENEQYKNEIYNLKLKLQQLNDQQKLQLQDLQQHSNFSQSPQMPTMVAQLYNSQVENVKYVIMHILKDKYNESDDFITKYQIYEIKTAISSMSVTDLFQISEFQNLQTVKQYLSHLQCGFWRDPQVRSKKQLETTIYFGQYLTVQHICLILTKEFTVYDISDFEWKCLFGNYENNVSSNNSNASNSQYNGSSIDLRQGMVKSVTGLLNDQFYVFYRIRDGQIFKTTNITHSFLDNVYGTSTQSQTRSQIDDQNCFDVILYTNQHVPTIVFQFPIRKLNYVNFGQQNAICLRYPQTLISCAINNVNILNLQNCINLQSLQSEKITYSMDQLEKLRSLRIFISKMDMFTDKLGQVNSSKINQCMVQTIMSNSKLRFVCINSGINVLQQLTCDYKQLQDMQFFVSLNNKNITVEIITNSLSSSQGLQNMLSTTNSKSPIPQLKFIQIENGHVRYIGDQTLVQKVEEQILPLKVSIWP